MYEIDVTFLSFFKSYFQQDVFLFLFVFLKKNRCFSLKRTPAELPGHLNIVPTSAKIIKDIKVFVGKNPQTAILLITVQFIISLVHLWSVVRIMPW